MNKCIGCGVIKQNIDQNKIGYVVKLENQYCLRCFKIKNYNELVPQKIHAEEFILRLKKILEKQNEKVEFFYILDIFDLQATRILEIEDLLSKFKTNIVVNKIDLLPKSVKLNKIRNYIKNEFKNTSLNNANIILSTTQKQNFVQSLLNKLKKEDTKKYFIGSSNVGKSSIINELLKANDLIPQIVVSNYFNTTLDFIEIKLNSDISIVDTPGVSRSNSIANIIDPKYWKYIYFNKEIKQFTYQIKSNNSIFFETIAWVDFITSSESYNNFHIYTNKNINVHRTSTKKALEYYEKNKQKLISSNNDKKINKYFFKFTKNDLNNEYDVYISGLGWINFKITDVCEFIINIPSGDQKVKVQLRKPLI